MKYLFRTLIAVCLLAFCSLSQAQPSTPPAFYYGNSPAGPFTGFEANIDGSDVYGTAFLRGGNDYVSFYGSADRAGNIRGTFSGSGGGTFVGKAIGNGMSFTLKSKKGLATFLGFKGTPGYAFSSIAGKYVYFNYYDPNIGNSSNVYVSAYFDSPTTVEIYVYYDGEEDYYVARYTYKKTGANTATLTVPVQGAGSMKLTFTSANRGTITGANFSTTFRIYDLSDD